MPRRSYERMNKAAARAGARGLPRAGCGPPMACSAGAGGVS